MRVFKAIPSLTKSVPKEFPNAKFKKFTSLLLALFILLVVVASMRGHNQNNLLSVHQQKGQPKEDEGYGPIANSAEPEDSDPAKRASRRAKGEHYKGGFSRVEDEPNSNGIEINRSDTYLDSIPAIPVAESNAVAIGEITDAKAYISLDKTGVYSEFTVKITDILKDDGGVLAAESICIVEREGGQVRFPSGNIQRFTLSGQGMPRVARRYVLFLKLIPQQQAFYILTAYELRSGQVFPLDKLARFATYKNMEEAAFIAVVREAVSR